MDTRDNLVTVEIATKLVVSGLPIRDKTADLESHLLKVEKKSWCNSGNTIDAELIFFKVSRLMPRFYFKKIKDGGK